MADTRFTLTVKRGVEYSPMTDLTQYELSSRVDTLREWFGLDSDDFGVTVDETPVPVPESTHPKGTP